MAKQLIPDSGTWSVIAGKINSNFDELYNQTGWADYSDTQYTNLSTFSVLANTDTLVPNNAGNTIESQKPSDVTSFYNGTTITGRNGDAISVTIDLDAVPTGGSTTLLEFWVDIGGAVGELYRHPITFPKGVGVVRHITHTFTAYTLDTWETNGATVYCRANGTADLYNIRYVIARLHKAQ